MALNWESLVFYVLLADSIIANLMACFGAKWYKKNFKGFNKLFPLSKGWVALYFILVLWIGWALYRLGLLWW